MLSKILSLFLLLASGLTAYSQNLQDSITDPQKQLNAAQRILSGNYASSVVLGAYGELTYNQPESQNGELDVQRLVVLLGYKFDERTQIVTEIEVEHVEEVFVEQAFINYTPLNNLNLRAGLMLVPMGIVNEFHEPTTFNGTERPAVDQVIIPSTWRELGVGVSGRINNMNLGYQAYIFNGFRSSENTDAGVNGLLKGSNGLRGGRQKGIKSTISSPTFSAKLDYYGIKGLRLGLSGYFGRTQTDDEIEDIDGTDIGVSMIGFDARYRYKKLSARGQFIYTSLSDTEDYNALTGRDLGSEMQGWYLEMSYNLLPVTKKQRLVTFIRYEQYDTHKNTDGGLLTNDAYNRSDITMGLSYHIAPGVVLKGDYQIRDNQLSGDDVPDQLNFGLGFWF